MQHNLMRQPLVRHPPGGLEQFGLQLGQVGAWIQALELLGASIAGKAINQSLR
jgi:hypothetical protein